MLGPSERFIAAMGRIFRRQSWFRRVVYKFDRPVLHRVDGFPIYIRPVSHISLFLGRKIEVETRKKFLRIAADIDARIFWDIGANLGIYSIAFIRQGGSKAVAFEPDPKNAVLIKATAQRHNLPIEIIEAAVSDRAGAAPFYVDTITGQTGSLSSSTFNLRTYGIESPVLDVPTVRLDDMPQPWPDTLKIDVEGAEMSVLKGAENILSTRPAILIELQGETVSEARQFLSRFAYQLTHTGEMNYLALPS